MTREILSSALDMIDERYIASVTDKKLKPAPKTTVYAAVVTEPSVWRRIINTAAVIVFAVGVIIGFILMRQSIGPGTTPGDSLTDTTGVDTTDTTAHDTTETEPDTTETEPIETETEPAIPEPVTISGVTYELRDGGYVVTGVTSTDADRAVLVDKVEEIEVIGISDGAFDSVDDPLNFRIFGYEGSYAHEYAVEHGHIFIEWYDGSFPDHYYPEGVTLNEWTKSEPNDVFIAVDDNAEIDALVAGYLAGDDTHDELLARVVYRLRCLNDLEEACELRQYYYTPDEYNAGDYDRYQIYIPVYLHNGNFQADAYTWERYGKIEYYDDYVTNAELLVGEYTDDYMINVEGWFFFPDMGIGSTPLCNITCEMTVEEGKVTLSCNYQKFYGEPWGEVKTGTAVLVRGENGWYFDTSYYCYSGVSIYLEHLFEDYLDEILG